MRLDLRDIAAIREVARNLSFTKAANRLGSTQPRLSLIVREFETQLGVRIFNRSSRTVEITPAGEEILRYAAAVENAVKEFSDGAAKLRRAQGSVLLIGAPTYSARVPRRLRMMEKFHSTHPGVSVSVKYGQTPHLTQQLLDADVDFAFLLEPEPSPHLKFHPIARGLLHLILQEDDPLARQATIHIDQLAGRVLKVMPMSYEQPFDRIYQPFVTRGCKIAPMYEAALPALIEHVRSSVQTGLCTFFEGEEIEKALGLTFVPVSGLENAPRLMAAVRADTRGAAAWLWAMAEKPDL